MKYLRQNIYITLLVSCLIALGLFLTLTNPADTSVGLLVVPVILLFFIAFCASHLVLDGIKVMAGRPRKKRIVALVSASFLTIIMILQSTGGISGPDVVLLGLIISVAAVYISKF